MSAVALSSKFILCKSASAHSRRSVLVSSGLLGGCRWASSWRTWFRRRRTSTETSLVEPGSSRNANEVTPRHGPPTTRPPMGSSRRAADDTKTEAKVTDPYKKFTNQWQLGEFFDLESNWVKSPEFPMKPGRAWNEDDLRCRTNVELHQIWFVLLRERNMLMTMEDAYKQRIEGGAMPHLDRIDRVEESMANLESVVRERNAAVLELEEGHSGERKTKTVTTFLGFRQQTPIDDPNDLTPKPKEYEVPYLDDDAYTFQKVWREKEWYTDMYHQAEADRKAGKLRYMYRYRRKA